MVLLFVGQISLDTYGQNVPQKADAGQNSSQNSNGRQPWAYRVFEWPVYGSNTERRELDSLNKLGANGWEMVGYSTENRFNKKNKEIPFHVFYLKRPSIKSTPKKSM